MPKTEMPKHKVDINSLIDAIPEAIISIDKDYKVTLINKSALELFNVKEKEAIESDSHYLLELYNKDGVPINPETYCFKKSKTKNFLEDSILLTKGNNFLVSSV